MLRKTVLPHQLGKLIFMKRMSKNTFECVCIVMNMASRFFSK